MGQALYRKYRSKSLDEIIGQEHITQTLRQALKSGRISHAYLLTGPRGVGKTSVARILAHEINDLPYTDDSMHIDIIEIDAASNRRIDEIRELRDKVYIAPTSAKYKVYIIDEVHMLTKEAFNALLKTLEEPPAHVVFILATTDAHKLPETIVSRTQRFTFKPVDKSAVIDHLKNIASKENINISEPALGLLAEHGEGSFRDSISLFDQASNGNKKIEIEDVRQLLGIPPDTAINQLISYLNGDNSLSDIATNLTKLYDQGFQASAIAKQISKTIRRSLINNQPIINEDDSLLLLTKLLEIPVSHDPERYLEIILLSFAKPTTAKPQPAVVETEIPKIAPPVIAKAPVPIKPMVETVKQPVKSAVVDAVPVENNESNEFNDTLWPEILLKLKKSHNTLYGVVRMAKPKFDTKILELSFAFAFHQKRINEAKNTKILADIVKQLTGKNIQIVCIVDKNASPPKVQIPTVAAKVETSNKNLTTVSNIFGGGELLES